MNPLSIYLMRLVLAHRREQRERAWSQFVASGYTDLDAQRRFLDAYGECVTLSTQLYRAGAPNHSAPGGVL